jgi:hypothetical protein
LSPLRRHGREVIAQALGIGPAEYEVLVAAGVTGTLNALGDLGRTG